MMLRRLLTHLKRDERGATAIEYALIAGIIGIAIMAALASFHDALVNTFNIAINGMNISS